MRKGNPELEPDQRAPGCRPQQAFVSWEREKAKKPPATTNLALSLDGRWYRLRSRLSLGPIRQGIVGVGTVGSL
jgi:hypothetical protein